MPPMSWTLLLGGLPWAVGFAAVGAALHPGQPLVPVLALYGLIGAVSGGLCMAIDQAALRLPVARDRAAGGAP